jgi:hypothetical protein
LPTPMSGIFILADMGLEGNVAHKTTVKI